VLYQKSYNFELGILPSRVVLSWEFATKSVLILSLKVIEAYLKT